MKYKIKAWKTLSRNDTGETNSHQSGISIIKDIAYSGIFPELTTDVLNPTVDISFQDEEGYKWDFKYKYYNDAFFGKPSAQSHNEFRLTRVGQFIKAYGLKAGNEIWFALDDDGNRIIGYEKEKTEDDDVIQIRHGWRMINI